MRTFLGQLVIAALLLAAGEAFRRAAVIEKELAQAEEDLATLATGTADAEYGQIEKDLGIAAKLPLVGPTLVADVRQERAMVAYWRADYRSVPSNEAELAAEDTNPDLVFLAGNAAYRNVLGRRTGQAGAQDLDAVLRLYTMLLKKSPSYVDGAYNYEYVVRLRNALAKMKPGGSPKGAPPNQDEQAQPSVHGEEGSPPQDVPPEQFNVIVPLRPEERGDLMKAGTGALKQRKG
jgi:hypothetical protein